MIHGYKSKLLVVGKPALNKAGLMNAPPSHQKPRGKMPVVQATELETVKLDDNAYRVLVTGFGVSEILQRLV